MDVFDLRGRLVEDYARYTRSFIKIADERIKARVDGALDGGQLWPEPLLQLNPTFLPGGKIDDLVADSTLHDECRRIFRVDKTKADAIGKDLILHTHQVEAIRKAGEGKSYVLTSGTGSGKSLTYIVPAVDHVLRRGPGNGIQAIVVYPMNALANSQHEELSKFLEVGYPEGQPPVRFARYTGQEKGDERKAIRDNPPDILLTNYMMLELLLTRSEDRQLVKAAQDLKFLVFDELHTYRGRQGADVALLIRRCRQAFGGKDIICVGTSATMASGGTSGEQKQAVAAVARTLFGTAFDASQVIGETLERATPEVDFENASSRAALATAVKAGDAPPEDYEAFRAHPLASWIESTFGVQTEAETGRLIRQTPRALRGPEGAAEDLAAITGGEPEACASVLRRFLMKGSQLKRSASSRFPIFAFRLHQFFTRADTVWSTIEPEGVRHLEMSKLGSKPGQDHKLMYPLVFCRNCGTPYYRVTVQQDEHGSVLLPREDRRAEGDDGQGDAYLYVSETAPWPRGTGPDVLARLPEIMKLQAADGTERVDPAFASDVPEPVFVAATGRIVAEGDGIGAALIRKNFLFCLHPGCGVAYTRRQKSERGKLNTLGVDNRSTATTILAVRSLIELQGDSSLKKEARKLLSFTDNRQDASLQAGHFNDFAQVALLRSALYKAAQARGTGGLVHGELTRAVFEALSLPFEDYAADADVRGPARTATEDALRKVIEYYLYRDLQRGWRVTAPNLEDCGLLHFEYVGLTGEDGLLGEPEAWEHGFNVTRDGEKEFLTTPPVLTRCGAELREELLRTLLEVLRRNLAVKSDVLDRNKQRDLIDQTAPRLLEGTVWYLEDARELVSAVVAYPRPQAQGDHRSDLFVSSYGGYGQYVRRKLKPFVDAGEEFKRPDVDRVIQFLFEALKRYGIVEQVRGGEVPGYQINPDALRWLAGEGKVRPVDRTRLLDIGEIPPETNEYFVQCYRSFVDLKALLEAREHTAQVSSEEREEREDRFRSAELPLLFCSPTMELGVDIAQLNVVNMRNVPPTSANYAQRSGRAGRGGQPALVYTYCAGRSPHDQYYFRRPGDMVAGSVTAPRIDLRNRDLVRTHVHAVWMGVATPSLGKTLMDVIDIQKEGDKIHLPIKPSIHAELVNPVHRSQAHARANQLIDSIREDLKGAPWFHEQWTKEVLDQLELSFDRACERWRTLYRAAVRQQRLHNRIVLDHARPEAERTHSKRLRAQAETQIKLLTEAEGVYEGDFYSYRYFASEGFLPGYNFPRLPLSAFVPARRRRKGRDEFLSRPRFLAIAEFGPRNLIYHEGARYRVYKVNLDFGTDDVEATHALATMTMKRCQECGYAHVEVGGNLKEVCDRCGAGLDPSTVIPELVRLQNVSLRLAQRITCDEEERQRFGYKLVSAYRFPETGGKADRLDAEVLVGDLSILKASYGDATTLYRVNLGWTNAGPNAPAGFLLDLERGYWASNPKDQDDANDAVAGRQMRVVPFVEDTKNALVLRMLPVRAPGEMASLQAAFKGAIQKLFQLESRELAAEALPSSKDRKEILFYEASEGGAGVLRQLVEDPKVIPRLAREALEICHFNPDTLEDTAGDRCGKACYSCLLDYGNQPDHLLLNRFAIRDVLSQLMSATCKPAGGMGTRAERLAALRAKCDSKLEKTWLELLEEWSLRLPTHAQVFITDQVWTQPDFLYKDLHVAVFIDGPPHDVKDQAEKDSTINQQLTDLGFAVIRFHHNPDPAKQREAWREIFQLHPDVFGALAK
jgi:very-short-patch-repair endonuclease